MKKIFLVCYGGGHVNMIIPVVKELLRSGFHVQVLGLTTARSVLIKNDIKCVGYFHYRFLFEDWEKIKAIGENLVKGLPCNDDIPIEESVAYMGLSYWDLEQKLGRTEAFELYKLKGRYCFNQTTILEKIISYEKPDYLITTNSPRSELASLIASNSLKIPNGCIIDQYHEATYGNRFKESHFIDHFFVPLPEDKNNLQELGINESRISISGNPAFENHFDIQYINESNQLIERYFKEKSIVLTYACTPTYSDYFYIDNDVINYLQKLVRKHQNIGIIVRFHPNDKITSEFKDNIFFSNSSQNIASILHSSDIIVSQGSTVGLEGKVLGKKIIQLHDSRLKEPICDQTSMGVATKIQRLDEIEQVVMQYSKSNGIQKDELRKKPSSIIVNHINKKLQVKNESR